MRLLLDTCTFLWLISEPNRLGPDARDLVEDGDNELVLHQASALEIQIKHQIGKLRLSESPERVVREGLHLHGIRYQTLEDSDIWHLKKLPTHHRDPFDRLLISSALCHGWMLVTPDPEIEKYPVRTIW